MGYNILNEPHPERLFDAQSLSIHEIKQQQVQEMLYEFYETVIQRIRHVDPETPIVVDSSAYAHPATFALLKPINDSCIIYSFHMYDPFDYTNLKRNRGRYAYPGKIAGGLWNQETLRQIILAVVEFQKRCSIPHHRILVGEFGAHRTTPGIDAYFKDLQAIFSQQRWHTAFYAFREDVWDGMDYELGGQKVSWQVQQARDRGERLAHLRTTHCPAIAVLLQALRAQ